MRQKGMTVVEILISIGIVSVFAVVLVSTVGGCRDADWQRAEKAAQDYAKNIGGATGKVSCMKMDSDGDGYCRCNVFRLKKDPLEIECGCDKYCIWCKEGCGGIKHSFRRK